MQLILQPALLFTLNLLDAVLTIYWVRHGIATEGNELMATLLDMGDLPFLLVKIGVGTAAALVLWRWGNLRLARFGLAITLAIYFAIMGVHLVTGLSAFGFLSDSLVRDIASWANILFAVFV